MPLHLKMKTLKYTLILAFLYNHVLSQPFSIGRTNDGAWIIDNGKKVLFYQAQTKSLDGKYPRANYVHPLYGLNGHVLTEDFPKDHLHHRGIFWTWHQVWIGDTRIGDAWECKDFVWDVVRYVEEMVTEGSIALSTHVLWKSPLWRDNAGEMNPFMKEKTVITVYNKQENYRIIDFEISLLALEDGLRVGGSEDQKGYGGFSVRIKMPEDIQFSSSQGQVLPQVTQVEADSWVDVSGSMLPDGGKAGLVIICHPDNPMFPEKWILRRKGSMQNPVYPGREPVSISQSDPTVLQYRLIIYEGDLGAEKIDKLQFTGN